MATVVIVIHLMVIIALIALVLMQRSEGGALGIGGAGNFLSTRSQGNVLTRSTAIVAAAFFATSILLSLIGRFAEKPSSILENVQAPKAPITAPAGQPASTGLPGGDAGAASGKTILDQLNEKSKGGAQTGGAAPAPATDGAPATPAPAGGAAAPAAPATPQVPTSQ